MGGVRGTLEIQKEDCCSSGARWPALYTAVEGECVNDRGCESTWGVESTALDEHWMEWAW